MNAPTAASGRVTCACSSSLTVLWWMMVIFTLLPLHDSDHVRQPLQNSQLVNQNPRQREAVQPQCKVQPDLVLWSWLIHEHYRNESLRKEESVMCSCCYKPWTSVLRCGKRKGKDVSSNEEQTNIKSIVFIPLDFLTLWSGVLFLFMQSCTGEQQLRYLD